MRVLFVVHVRESVCVLCCVWERGRVLFAVHVSVCVCVVLCVGESVCEGVL